MSEFGSSFPLVQERYRRKSSIVSLPGFMNGFPNDRCFFAVITNDAGVHCMLVSSSGYGVFVSVDGLQGRFFLVSRYCRFSEDLNPYMRYMDSVLLLAVNTTVPSSRC